MPFLQATIAASLLSILASVFPSVSNIKKGRVQIPIHIGYQNCGFDKKTASSLSKSEALLEKERLSAIEFNKILDATYNSEQKKKLLHEAQLIIKYFPDRHSALCSVNAIHSLYGLCGFSYSKFKEDWQTNMGKLSLDKYYEKIMEISTPSRAELQQIYETCKNPKEEILTRQMRQFNSLFKSLLDFDYHMAESLKCHYSKKELLEMLKDEKNTILKKCHHVWVLLEKFKNYPFILVLRGINLDVVNHLRENILPESSFYLKTNESFTSCLLYHDVLAGYLTEIELPSDTDCKYSEEIFAIKLFGISYTYCSYSSAIVPSIKPRNSCVGCLSWFGLGSLCDLIGNSEENKTPSPTRQIWLQTQKEPFLGNPVQIFESFIGFVSDDFVFASAKSRSINLRDELKEAYTKPLPSVEHHPFNEYFLFWGFLFSIEITNNQLEMILMNRELTSFLKENELLEEFFSEGSCEDEESKG